AGFTNAPVTASDSFQGRDWAGLAQRTKGGKPLARFDCDQIPRNAIASDHSRLVPHRRLEFLAELRVRAPEGLGGRLHDMQRKIIISCAVTGSADSPGKNPAVPVTPEQIAKSSIDAAKAGAAVVHIHVRNPQTTKPSMDGAL